MGTRTWCGRRRRVVKELEIAAHYGDGHVVLCNLETPKQYPEIAEVVKAALTEM